MRERALFVRYSLAFGLFFFIFIFILCTVSQIPFISLHFLHFASFCTYKLLNCLWLFQKMKRNDGKQQHTHAEREIVSVCNIMSVI